MRSFSCVVKPSAGARLLAVTRILRAAGGSVTTNYTRSLEHARELARAAVQEGHTVVAVGGDGLTGAVAGAVSAAGGVLGLVPAGRGNDFARQMGIPATPEGAAEVLLGGRERAVDLIDAGGRAVAGNVHAGIDSITAERVNRSWVPGRSAYYAEALRTIATWRPVTYRVTIDGEDLEERGFTVVAANSGYYGAGLHVAPDAVPDDGLLDVVAIRDAPKRLFFAVMRELRTGVHVRRPEVVVRRGRSVRIEADRPELPVYGDGESLGRVPVTATVLPGALAILAP